MMNNNYNENTLSRDPAIALLEKLGYTYISPAECKAERGSGYDTVLKNILRQKLIELNSYTYANKEHKFSPANIERAIEDIDEPLTDGLIKTSEKIYDMLMLGKSYQENLDDGKILSFNLRYIDWDNFSNNVFHVTKEFSVDNIDKSKSARPDIVLFINGIPFATIECKSPDILVDQAVEQTIRNQTDEYIPQLFKFVQIVMATNKNSVKYATAGTAKKFWNIWREQDTEFLQKELNRCVSDRVPTEQDRNIVSLFSRQRVEELIKYFIIYDANVKKICRYQQFFALKEMIRTITTYDDKGNRCGGVIWHTQGSGKSLTMDMVSKYILMELAEYSPKVIIVTDRKELDSQIAATFAHTRLNPARATSGNHLVSLINEGKADVITTIINKFNTAEKNAVKNESRDIFVLIDESHRTNYGQLATKMRLVFSNACYIGFTGTPLMKKEKNTISKFGKLIHKYTIKDGVDDGAIVPLIYEGRFVDQKVDEENIDLWFEKRTKLLTDAQKDDIARKWSTIRRLSSTDARIKRIALDIDEHFIEGYKNTGFKAMLATNYKRDAVRYLECFESFGDLTCAVVISAPDMREGIDDFDESTDDMVVKFWNKMMKQYGNENVYEEAIKNKFCDGEIDILIVCSKLLTGFDAPVCQVLYIDKELKEHGLLQAIARTNRIAEGKDYGLIVDYRGLIEKLDDAMEMYSGAGLENFESGDLKGVIVDIISAVGSLRNAYSNIEALFTGVKNKADVEEYETALADEKTRKDFYGALSVLGRSLSVVLNSEKAYAAVGREELEKYKQRFVFFSKIRRSVKIRYFDAIDNAGYEPLMQNLLDTHLSVAGLKQITAPVDILNKSDLEKELEELGSAKAKADAIVSRLIKSISEKYDENPAYYESFSEHISNTLKDYREKIISDADYLKKVREIADNYRSGNSGIIYPESIKNNVHAQAFYGVISAIFSNLENVNISADFAAEISIDITKIVSAHSQVDWTNNKTIHDRIAQDIDDLFYKYEKEKGLKLKFDTIDMIIDNVKTVALRRF